MTEQLFEEYTTPSKYVVAAVKEVDSPTPNPEPSASPAIEEAAPASEQPVDRAIVQAASISAYDRSLVALLDRDEAAKFRSRWNTIQGKFVDEPCSAVQQADALVAELIAHISQIFAGELNSLEAQWNQGNEVSTEDLRLTLQRYRSILNRLVG